MSGLTVLVNVPALPASGRPGKVSGRAIPGPAAPAAMMEIRDEMLTSARGQDNLLFMRERSSSRLTKELVLDLWTKTYNTEGKPDWSHILPYYDDNIYFRDSIQEIRGIEEFTAMTERLAKRSKDLKMKIVNAVMEGDLIMMEWEMTIKFKKNPSSVLYGSSRLTLNGEGQIIQQRDYYDLWGDIFDNIPRFGKAYRKFMIRKFG